jgi:putative chitinase
MITSDQLRQLFPRLGTPKELADILNDMLPKYGVNTAKRIAAFLAQCGHESGGFTRFEENLNYSATGLIGTWPKRFPVNIASAYARQPERIANRAYANRMGNGPEESGDGWKFRGRGAIHITGRDNCEAFAESIGKTLDETLEYLGTLEGAIESACWYWTKGNLNHFADAGNMIEITKRVNGGTIGLDERKALYNKALKVIG